MSRPRSCLLDLYPQEPRFWVGPLKFSKISSMYLDTHLFYMFQRISFSSFKALGDLDSCLGRPKSCSLWPHFYKLMSKFPRIDNFIYSFLCIFSILIIEIGKIIVRTELKVFGHIQGRPQTQTQEICYLCIRITVLLF